MLDNVAEAKCDHTCGSCATPTDTTIECEAGQLAAGAKKISVYMGSAYGYACVTNSPNTIFTYELKLTHVNQDEGR